MWTETRTGPRVRKGDETVAQHRRPSPCNLLIAIAPCNRLPATAFPKPLPTAAVIFATRALLQAGISTLSRQLRRLPQRFEHAAFIGDAFAGDVEGCAVID